MKRLSDFFKKIGFFSEGFFFGLAALFILVSFLYALFYIYKCMSFKLLFELLCNFIFLRIIIHAFCEDKELEIMLSRYLLYMLVVQTYRSEEHTSELQSRGHLVCCLMLVK